MKFTRSFISFTLALLMLAGPVITAEATAPNDIDIHLTYINPLYEELLTESDLVASVPHQSRNTVYASSDYATTAEEAGKVMRDSMKQRQEICEIHYQTTGYDEDALNALL